MGLTNPPFAHDFGYLLDGEFTVCALGDGSLKAINDEANVVARFETAHAGMVTTLESRGGIQFLTAGIDNCVKVWELAITSCAGISADASHKASGNTLGDGCASSITDEFERLCVKSKSHKKASDNKMIDRSIQSDTKYSIVGVTRVHHEGKVNCLRSCTDKISHEFLVGDGSNNISYYSLR